LGKEEEEMAKLKKVHGGTRFQGGGLVIGKDSTISVEGKKESKKAVVQTDNDPKEVPVGEYDRDELREGVVVAGAK
jgi:hypothetical protein